MKATKGQTITHIHALLKPIKVGLQIIKNEQYPQMDKYLAVHVNAQKRLIILHMFCLATRSMRNIGYNRSFVYASFCYTSIFSTNKKIFALLNKYLIVLKQNIF